MAVLAEAISVVIKVESLLSLATEDQIKFTQSIPNKTFCGDGELIRVGFMNPADVHSYVEQLKSLGLIFIKDDHAIDLVVVDQLKGPIHNCSWIDFGVIDLNDSGNKIKSCKLKGSTISQVSCPSGWSFENSLSSKSGFISNDEESDKLTFLRRDDDMDVYLNNETGKEVFVGRPNSENRSNKDSETND
jgi:hypothetical protein